MKIGIIGGGSVGSNLGIGWAAAGHSVSYGLREPHGDKARRLIDAVGNGVRAVSVADAAAQADLVVLAVPYPAVAAVLEQAGPLADKIVVDATNPIEWRDGPFVAAQTSGAEEIAERLPDAKIVKAFNAIGAEHFLDSSLAGERADIFVCGNPEARPVVASLAHDLGFRSVDVGGLENARKLEEVAALWIWLATVGERGREIAFKLVAD